MVSFTILWWMVHLIPNLVAQETALPGPQCQDFASSYELSVEQISRANISNTTAHNVEIALNFERSNWATNSVTVDPFYRVPSNWSSAIPPGSLLTVENVANTSLYTLPASVALSRITYQTLTVNGTAIPASAYILWPYLPRAFRNISGLPVIGWAHGTSGVLPECAPSHIRNLWYQYSGPFIMALQGYVVVAPDYAGLGIGSSSKSSSSTTNSYSSPDDEDVQIRHPYINSHSHAQDLLYSIQAAQSAFPSLSRSFVTIGHSQGGGATWAAATLDINDDDDNNSHHLGAIAGSPTPVGPSYLPILSAAAASGSPVSVYLAYGIHASYPSVPRAELFTPAGLARLQLLEELGGCSGVAAELFAPPDNRTSWVSPGLASHWATRAYAAAGDFSGKRLRAPLLVLQGLADPGVLPALTEASVNRTCGAFPQDSDVEYVAFEGVTHVPVMYAGQRVWLDWVADRFEGVPVERGCRRRRLGGLRAEGDYLAEFNYFLEPVTAGYQIA